MTIYDTRRENARRLVGSERGALAKFAERVGISKQQVSHIIGARPIKHIGHDLARRVEQSFGVPVGSLDVKPGDSPPPSNHTMVPLLLSAADMPELMAGAWASSLTVDNEWIRRNLGAAPELVAALPASGDTMAPTIMDGDLCLIDRGATRIDRDGVYVILREQSVHILRASRPLDGGYVFACDNQAYPPYPVPDLMKAGLLVMGRVVATLRPNRI
jgi:hypothetical protein